MAGKSELPKSYEERMERMLGEDFPAYLECLTRSPFHGIRVNTAKLSKNQFRHT